MIPRTIAEGGPRGSALCRMNMLGGKRVCIFVDGENLRYSISGLFLYFNRRDYLPRTDWGAFFDWIAQHVSGQDANRVRTYWYVVQNIDYSPYDLGAARKDPLVLEKVLMRDVPTASLIASVLPHEKTDTMQGCVDNLETHRREMDERFKSWIKIQDGIARRHPAVEFRRAGYIRYDLFERVFGSEKSVDVKLATDLFRLKDIYDTAVIVSGDQDYVPAVEAVKDAGKHVVNVAFLTSAQRLLPGGARRLNQITDWCIEIPYTDSKRLLSL